MHLIIVLCLPIFSNSNFICRSTCAHIIPHTSSFILKIHFFHITPWPHIPIVQLTSSPGADPGFDRGGPLIVTGLKLPFLGLSFVEFWCWGLIFGGQGGPRPPGPPLDLPLKSTNKFHHLVNTKSVDNFIALFLDKPCLY